MVSATTAIVLRAPAAGRTWRRFGYVLTAVPVAIAGFVLAVLGAVAAVLAVLTVGLPLLVLVLAATRRFTAVPLALGRSLLGWPWHPMPRPSLPRPVTRGIGRWAGATLADVSSWRALAYFALKLPVALASAYAALLLLAGGVFALSAPAWWWLSPTGWGLLDVGGWGRSWLVVPAGVGAVLLLPGMLLVGVSLDGLLARALLSPGRERYRIQQLESGRTVLVADNAATLRRVERELHDGTQAALVTLGMLITRADQRLAALPNTDPAEVAQARSLLRSAADTTGDALDQLRGIVRRIHPPALDDGLDTALRTLAARNPLPTAIAVSLTRRPDAPVAATLYFAAAELLANTTRHASATRVSLDLAEHGSTVVLTVADDGTGGATLTSAGTGLIGLARRVEPLDGTLTVNSPLGGPTTVTVSVPNHVGG